MQVTITQKQQRYISWTTDVLVYIIVLNLFVEFVDAIVIDSFWISILTAVLLKALLDVVIRLEHRVGTFLRQTRRVIFQVHRDRHEIPDSVHVQAPHPRNRQHRLRRARSTRSLHRCPGSHYRDDGNESNHGEDLPEPRRDSPLGVLT